MVNVRPTKIPGRWREGYALDYHTISSTYLGDAAKARGRKVLLFDDLYRSGATMNAIAAVLLDQGAATEVFALAITRTRSNL